MQTFRTASNRKLIVAELRPPAVFGEMGCVGQCCIIVPRRRPRLRAFALFRTDLDAQLDEHPLITRRLLDLVSQRFAHVLLDLEATSFRHLIPRLAKLLLENAGDQRVPNMTHREMAEHLRVYRESATTVLGELKKAGIIAIERKQVRILDRARLERAAREQAGIARRHKFLAGIQNPHNVGVA